MRGANLDLNPGLSQVCARVYEVPTNTTGFGVVFSTPDGDEQTVDLGF